jgi:hypothetical protein
MYPKACSAPFQNGAIAKGRGVLLTVVADLFAYCSATKSILSPAVVVKVMALPSGLARRFSVLPKDPRPFAFCV